MKQVQAMLSIKTLSGERYLVSGKRLINIYTTLTSSIFVLIT